MTIGGERLDAPRSLARAEKKEKTISWRRETGPGRHKNSTEETLGRYRKFI